MDMYKHLVVPYAKEAQVNITSGSLRDYLGFRSLSIHRQNSRFSKHLLGGCQVLHREKLETNKRFNVYLHGTNA